MAARWSCRGRRPRTSGTISPRSRRACDWPRSGGRCLRRVDLAKARQPPPRKRADMLLVERGLFESRARAQAAIEAGLVTANDKQVTKPSEGIAGRRGAAGAAGASLRVARRRQAVRRAGAISDRNRESRLPRCRRIHRRFYRGAARERRQPGVCHRRRTWPVASVAARPPENRFDGRNRYSRASRASGCRCGRMSSSSMSASFR